MAKARCYTAVSLFSGIGMFDWVFSNLGVDIVAQSEIDPFCRAVLEYHKPHHWPNAVLHGDVHDIGKGNLPRVDVLAGGVPCQPASTAGKRKGKADDRWLWPEAIRLVSELRPRACFFENVPGLRSLHDGEAFKEIVQQLAAFGYVVEWRTLAACDFGASHIRKRLYIVAYTPGQQRRNSQSDRQSGQLELSQGQENASHAGGCDQAVGLSNVERLEIGRSAKSSDSTQPTADGASGRITQSNLGLTIDGYPGLVAQCSFPARPGEEQYDWEAPRTVQPKSVENRVAMLTALGNSIVPQTLVPYARALIRHLEECDGLR